VTVESALSIVGNPSQTHTHTYTHNLKPVKTGGKFVIDDDDDDDI